jgi:hypothetical protein
MNSEEISESAELALALGFVPIILRKGTKIPVRPGWQNTTYEQAEDFFSKPRFGFNIGVVTGEVSNLTVIDIERADLEKWNEFMLEHNNGRPIKTLIMLTGGGGEHYYFKYFKSRNGVKIPLDTGGTIDIRSDKGQVVFYGSVTQQKYVFRDYEPDESGDFGEIAIADAPKWLKKFVQEKQRINL